MEAANLCPVVEEQVKRTKLFGFNIWEQVQTSTKNAVNASQDYLFRAKEKGVTEEEVAELTDKIKRKFDSGKTTSEGFLSNVKDQITRDAVEAANKATTVLVLTSAVSLTIDAFEFVKLSTLLDQVKYKNAETSKFAELVKKQTTELKNDLVSFVGRLRSFLEKGKVATERQKLKTIDKINNFLEVFKDLQNKYNTLVEALKTQEGALVGKQWDSIRRCISNTLSIGGHIAQCTNPYVGFYYKCFAGAAGVAHFGAAGFAGYQSSVCHHQANETRQQLAALNTSSNELALITMNWAKKLEDIKQRFCYGDEEKSYDSDLEY